MTWENYEHDVFAAEREAYPREQYEADRAKAIAEGVDPRLIMSYVGCLSSMAWDAEQEREREEAEAYDEAMAERERIAFFEWQLAEWDAEMEAEGVEDATAWPKFPEYERVLYALVEWKTFGGPYERD